MKKKSGTHQINLKGAPELSDPRKGQVSDRRCFLFSLGSLATAATAVLRMPELEARGWRAAAAGFSADVVSDTFNALLAFTVPGPDSYSIAQGVSTSDPGGVDANVTEVLIETLDQTAPYAPTFSAIVAAILNDLAALVNPGAGGSFPSQFARLSFNEKVAVIQIMDSTAELKALSGVLLAFVIYLAYSEAGVLDPSTRTLTGTPVGWQISEYQGVADGRDELLGYYKPGNRRGGNDA